MKTAINFFALLIAQQSFILVHCGSTRPIPETPLIPPQPIIPPWFDGITLIQAVEMGDLEAVKYRIGAAGDNVTAEREDRDPSSPIHAAAAKGELDILKYLVEEAGVPLDSTDQSGRTPLHSGAQGCQLDVIKYLVEMGADLSSEMERGGKSPLLSAVESDCAKVISYLLEQGAELDAANENRTYGNTLLHIAARGKRIQTVAALLDGGAPLEAKNRDGLTPLHLAISGDGYILAPPVLTNMIKYLIARGADVKAVDARGNNLLDTVANSYEYYIQVDVSLVEYLVDSGVELNEKIVSKLMRWGSPAGEYVLGRWRTNSSSSSEGSTTTTQEAPPNLEDVPLEYKYMDLEEAIWSGDMAAVRYRISTVGNNNNNISAGSYYDGICPMRAAISSGNLEMVKYLVEEAGLDVNNAHQCDTNDYPNETPLHASMQLFCCTPVGQLVTRATAMEVVRYLMGRGANPNATDSVGKSPLHVAAQGAYLEPVQYLVEEAGADVSAKDNQGSTPLHEAAEGRSLHISYFLVEHGASVNDRDERGLTPLASLVYLGKGNILPLIKYLVRSGADINAQFQQDDGTRKLGKIADYRITVSVSDFLREAGLLEVSGIQCKNGSTPIYYHHVA